MKIRKKIIAFSFIMLFIATFMTACEKNDEYEDAGNISKEKNEELSFVYNEKTINIGEKWSDVHKKLGEYESMFVAESCAYQGTDRYYYYKDFEIMTSEIDGQELLTDIFIEKENINAINGVCVGMGLSDIASKMGPADKTLENGFVYSGDMVNVQINVKDDKVISIEYFYEEEK